MSAIGTLFIISLTIRLCQSNNIVLSSLKYFVAAAVWPRNSFDTSITFLILFRKPSKCKCEDTGIYDLKCPSSNKVRIGQTGRNSKTRFQEHIKDTKNNWENSKFTAYILNNKHSYGPIDKMMTKIDHTSKGGLMNIKESMHIYVNRWEGHLYLTRNMIIFWWFSN
jgi:hypothetical protein